VRLNESIAAFNQRFIFPLPFAMKITKINLWNQGISAFEIIQNQNFLHYEISTKEFSYLI
jgi:hypothetical protein